MRVVGGSARGRRLKSPEGRAIRPSTDRIRESMFNLLGPGDLAEQALDAFAGTGALGIEALSRGVPWAVFVERDPRALALVQENLRRCGFEDRARVRRADTLQILQSEAAACDLVFLDPPYRKGLVEACLAVLGDGLLPEGARVVCECEADLELAASFGDLTQVKQKRYGDIRVSLFEVQAC